MYAIGIMPGYTIGYFFNWCYILPFSIAIYHYMITIVFPSTGFKPGKQLFEGFFLTACSTMDHYVFNRSHIFSSSMPDIGKKMAIKPPE